MVDYSTTSSPSGQSDCVPHVTLDSRRCWVLRFEFGRDHLGGWPVDVNHGDVGAFFDEHPSFAATNAVAAPVTTAIFSVSRDIDRLLCALDEGLDAGQEVRKRKELRIVDECPEGVATINRQLLSGDPRRFGSSEEPDGIRDVFYLTGAVIRSPLHECGEHVGIVERLSSWVSESILVGRS